MKKRILAALLATATLALSAVNVFANGGIGLDADPDATCDYNPHKIILLEEVQFKEYINEGDPVVATLPAGTILETNNNVFRKGKDTGWSDALIPNQGSGFFDRTKAQTQKYDPKCPVELEISDQTHDITIRLPENGDEKYEYEISDPSKIQVLTSEDADGKFVISFHLVSEKVKEGDSDEEFEKFPSGSIHFVGKLNGEKAHDFTINLGGGEVSYEAWAVEKPLDFSEIKPLIDHTEEKYLKDGSTVKVNILKDGRIIDMNGFECTGIADDANQMHDGTIIYDYPTSK